MVDNTALLVYKVIRYILLKDAVVRLHLNRVPWTRPGQKQLMRRPIGTFDTGSGYRFLGKLIHASDISR